MSPLASTFEDCRQDLLDRAGEDPSDAAGDYYATAERQLARGLWDIYNAHPFLFLRAAPPGVFRTVAPITTGTVSVTNGSTALTFSSAPVASVQDRELRVTGWNEAFRIASHTAGAAAATLDSAYNGVTNAVAAYTVFQREYDLASDVRHIVEMLVADGGHPIVQKEEGWLRREYRDPPSAVWPPRYFARIGERRIRFEGYPDRTRRIEYAYTIHGTEFTAGVTPLVPLPWRYVITDHGLYWTFMVLDDTRADAAGIFAGAGVEKLIKDDLRKRMSLSEAKAARGTGPYGGR